MLIFIAMCFQNNLTWKEREKKMWHTNSIVLFFFLHENKMQISYWIAEGKIIWIKYEIKSCEHRIFPLNFRYCKKATKLNKKSPTFFEIT